METFERYRGALMVELITQMLPMMGTMEFICGVCVGVFVSTCLTTIAHVIDLERNKKKR